MVKLFLAELAPDERSQIIDVLESNFENKLERLHGLTKNLKLIRYCETYLEDQRFLKSLLPSNKCINRFSFILAENAETIAAILANEILNTKQKIASLKLIFPNENICAVVIHNIYVPWTHYQNKKKESNYKILLEEKLQSPLCDKVAVLDQIKDSTLASCIKTLLDLRLENDIRNLISDENILKECLAYIRYMAKEDSFLHKIPQAYHVILSSILRETALTDFDKQNLFKHALPNQAHRKMSKALLKELAQLREIDLANEMQRQKKMELKNQLESFPNDMTLVLLGASGVGKSTFINGFANFLNYISLQDAKDKGVRVLISTCFTHTDRSKDMKTIEIKMVAPGDKNENLALGDSSTQHVRVYEFRWTSNGSERRIRFLDTPGLADSRGTLQDLSNLNYIFKALSGFKTINGICLLVKSGVSRLTDQFSYVLAEFLSQLPPAAANNILFCCTSSRKDLYKPGDTLKSLRVYLKEQNVDIKLDKNTMYCVDNECFQFLCAWQKIKYTPSIIQTYSDSWNFSFIRSFELLKGIQLLPPLDISPVLSLVNARKCFGQVCKRITLAQEDELSAEKIITENKAVIALCEQREKDIKANSMKKTSKKSPTGRIDTVCQTCAKPDGTYFWFKEPRCHQNCTCTQVPEGRLNDPKIYNCSCFTPLGGAKSEKCVSCGCHWSCHTHVSYELTTVDECILSEKSKKNLKKIENDNISAQERIFNQTKKKEIAEKELKFLNEIADELAQFIKANSLVPLNKFVDEYLAKEIEIMQTSKPNSHEIIKLSQLKDSLSQQKRIMDRVEGTAKSQEEIKTLIDDLKSSIGSQELKKLLLNVDLFELGDINVPIVPVDLTKGWIGDV